MPTEKEIVVSGEKALRIAEVLNATTLKILKSARNAPLNITTIAKNLKLSEAFISEQIRALEDLGLVSITYERGQRGTSKISSSALEKITFILKDEDLPPSDQHKEKSC
jgi:predicted transcriptional regulator